MCGIIGYISKSKPIERTLFERMTDILVHRGPDDRGTFYINNIALGHRRLSIIDLSEKGNQPMRYMNKYVIVFNGEIYNYLEIKEELATEGYNFDSMTDTEVVVASYDKWGFDCLNRFNGMWAFAIYNIENETLFCSRDRFGIKPLYYTIVDDSFVFSSEIKAILPILSTKPTANISRVLDNILYGVFDHTDDTLFEHVFQVKPGHLLSLNSKLEIDIRSFYDIDKIKQNKNSYEDNVLRFKELLQDSVRLRLRSDVPIGSCLSGGLDSSSIVCLAASLMKENGGLRHDTISSCYNTQEEMKYDEQEYIDVIVEKAQTSSHKIFPSINHFFQNLDRIVYYQDEPVGAISLEPQFNVFNAARELGLTVMLDGQGADEHLGGYSQFYSVKIRDDIRKLNLFQALREFRSFSSMHSDSEIYGTRGLIWFATRDLLPPFVERNIIKLTTSREEFEWLKIPYDSKIIEDIRRFTNFDDYTKKSLKYGLVQLLHYEDRNSMAHSIEGRLPFLDYRLVEHVVSLPPNQKLLNGTTKRILRDSMIGILPEKIRTRKTKLGFAVPYDTWIMKNSDLIRHELSDSLSFLERLLDKNRIINWFDKHNKNELALKNPILWRIISTGKWIRIFNISV